MPSNFTLIECAGDRRTCHHNYHPFVVVYMHVDCHNLLQSRFSMREGKALLATGELWRDGASTLHVSAPMTDAQRRNHRFNLTLKGVSSQVFRAFLLDRRSDQSESELATASTHEALHRHVRFPFELQEVVVHYAWCSNMLSPAVVLDEARHLFESSRTPRALKHYLEKPIYLTSVRDIFLGTMIVEGSPYVSYVAEQRISASYRKVHSIAQTFSIVLVQDEIGIHDVHFVGKDAATVSKAYESTSITSFRSRSIRANKDTPIAQIRGISDVVNRKSLCAYMLSIFYFEIS
jgi:hypothetical protein